MTRSSGERSSGKSGFLRTTTRAVEARSGEVSVSARGSEGWLATGSVVVAVATLDAGFLFCGPLAMLSVGGGGFSRLVGVRGAAALSRVDQSSHGPAGGSAGLRATLVRALAPHQGLSATAGDWAAVVVPEAGYGAAGLVARPLALVHPSRVNASTCAQ